MTAGLAIVAGVTLSACRQNASEDTSTINWYTPTEILTLDMSKNTDSYSALAIGNSGMNLLRQGKNGTLQPDAATSVTVSADGLTYTATLRDGLKWSDGSDLTAEDFVYSWRRIVDPKTASEYAYLVTDAHVKNAEEVLNGEKPVSELGVKAEGNKVIFTLSEPSPFFEDLLSFANFVPQKEAFVKKAGSNYGTTSKAMLYSGAYTVSDWNGTNGSWTLKKNKYYWDAKHVKTKTINVQTIKKPDTAVQMFKRGQLDIANISNTQPMYIANASNPSVTKVSEAASAYMSYNLSGSVKPLMNTKIRQALNLATNRDGVVKAAIDTGSVAAQSLVPKSLETLPNGQDLSDYVAPGYHYDPKEAAKLFKEGLAELGVKSINLTITADSESPAAKAAVDYLQQSWQQALPGLTINEKFVTFKQRVADLQSQNYEVALTLWGGDYPEGSTFYGLFNSTSSNNYGKVNDANYDAVYNKAISTDAMDKMAGAEDYKAAEKILYDNAYYNPLYARSSSALQNKKIKGLIRNSTGLSVDFTYAYKTK
nr:peptide ABC transporter substrate-binding protein [Streptococcus sp. DD12]